jgi:hypothetical protein
LVSLGFSLYAWRERFQLLPSERKEGNKG